MSNRPSKIGRLPEPVRSEVDRLIRSGRTIDEIVAKLRELGEEVSRSSVHRYKSRMDEAMRKYREAQEIAGVWVGALNINPNSDVGRLLGEMLKTLAFRSLADLGDGEDAPGPRDLMFLAKALKDLEGAQRLTDERIAKIRAAAMAEAAEAVVEAGKAEGLTAATVDAIKRKVLGVRDGA